MVVRALPGGSVPSAACERVPRAFERSALGQVSTTRGVVMYYLLHVV